MWTEYCSDLLVMMVNTADVSCTAEEFKCKTDGVCIQDRYVEIRSSYFDKMMMGLRSQVGL